MQVFEMASRWLGEHVTVFANSEQEARAIYREWVEAHHPGRPVRPGRVYPFNEEQLKHRPVLEAAAKMNTAGVGYWGRVEQHWLVAHACNTPLGDLAEPEPPVGYFEVDTDEGEHTRVFAVSEEQATTLYIAYELHKWGVVPKSFTVRKKTRWHLTWEFITLRDDMQAGVCGIGLPDERGIWRIQSPEHDWDR